ncbi:YrhB family protein [Roseiconus lacunae]|uniref:YrhB family protein n=1 Tax=Roseiconus lacunae TaxID=2605694 RepID=UPI001E340949|nr:YrhB family protein [Roseiconus lacunae]MCD0460587.1 YrhB family protein [Roseiconus lacunae]
MSFTLEQAIEHLYSSVLHRDETAPLEERTIIFDDGTITKKWGWVFFYNNEKYYRTRDPSDAHVGAGPLFFNRDTGEIRQHGSGCNMDAEIYDYEMEIEADGKTWCLWLSGEQDRIGTILKLKSLLRIDTPSAQRLVGSLPTAIFHGIRRHLDWMRRQFDSQGIVSYITLETEPPECHEFAVPARYEHMSNVYAHHAFHDRWEPDW